MTLTVSDIMTRQVRSFSPAHSLASAALAMRELNVGSVPICDGEKLVGMVTDRDIIVRGVAKGLDCAAAQLSEVMSHDVQWCFEDQSMDDLLRLMGDAQVRRMPVVNHERQLVGIVALGDIARRSTEPEVAAVLQDISEPAIDLLDL